VLWLKTQCPHKEFLNPRPPRTSSKFNPHPHAKQCGYPQPARFNPPGAGL